MPTFSLKDHKVRRFSGLFRYLLLLILILSFVFSLYVVYLNHQVQTQFEGKRWQVPSRVYARPLELYAEKNLSQTQLLYELRLLRFQENESLQQGSFYRKRKSVYIQTRGFQFWDETQPPIFLEVKFKHNKVDSLWNVNTGNALPIWRLAPLFIGGIYPKQQEDRVLLKLADVPDSLIETLLAVEDRNFYRHHGVSPLSILRALLANIRAGSRVQGGSTLTQQLVKNFFLTNEKTVIRKINEAIMALLLEWHYDKDEILEAYLNEIYLGQDGGRAIHGFGLAAHFYFDTSLSTLNSGQIALLVGLVKGASYYDPRRHQKRAKERRLVVLQAQEKLGLLPAESVRRFDLSPLGVSKNKPSGVTRYPAFMDLVKRQLVEDYRPEDLSSEGLLLFTSIDPWYQLKMEKALSRQLRILDKKSKLRKGALQAAAILTDSGSAAVRAMVGGRDFRSHGFNRALDAQRHIGSLIKPAVYLTALQQPEKYHLVSVLQDIPIRIPLENGNVWTPQNYDRKFHGEISLISALAHSYNAATVRLGMQLGLDNIERTIRALGVKKPLDLYPSMLLGATSMSALEVLQMYQTISEQGMQTPIRAIQAVTTAEGQVLSKYPLQVQETIEAESVYLLLRSLEEVVNSGTARYAKRKLGKGFNLAGKTGTTNDNRDSWFAGITGDKVGVVWLGDDDNKPTGLTGSSGALRVWTDIMLSTSDRSLEIPVPETIRFAKVDALFHQKSGSVCLSDVVIPFSSEYVPQKRSGVSCLEN